jgi:hypothetical protein
MPLEATYKTGSVPEENRQLVAGSYKYNPVYRISTLPK